MEFRLSIVIYKVYWMSPSSVAEIVVEIILYKLANQSYGAFLCSHARETDGDKN